MHFCINFLSIYCSLNTSFHALFLAIHSSLFLLLFTFSSLLKGSPLVLFTLFLSFIFCSSPFHSGKVFLLNFVRCLLFSFRRHFCRPLCRNRLTASAALPLYCLPCLIFLTCLSFTTRLVVKRKILALISNKKEIAAIMQENSISLDKSNALNSLPVLSYIKFGLNNTTNRRMSFQPFPRLCNTNTVHLSYMSIQ